MKPATKAELRDKLIDRYQAFTKWVLRQSPEIEELTLVKDYLKEIDSVEAQIRASEQGSSPVEQPINTNIKTYICTDCKAVNYLSDNGKIRVGFCNQCGHPLWNP
jgi:RNase P subunit RPR2